MQGPAAKLARTSSAMSTSSDTSVASSSFVNESGAGTVARRTRTRFTHTQLAMLERLYARTSHPTRDDRDALGRAAGMETKHITIWFQNKRQNERKVALQGATNNRTQVHPAQPQPQPPHRHLHYNNTLASPYTPIPGPDSPHLGPRAPVAPRARTRSHTTANQYPLARARTHPSLDHIASRSELRSPPSPNSPVRTRARTNSAPHAPENLWDSMPSSPLAPHADPVRECEREYVEFGRQIRGTSGRGRKTLEWACASARVSSSSASERKENCRKRKEMDVDAELNLDDLGVESDVTDDAEVHEALTPSNSFGHSVGTGVMGRNSKGTEVNDVRVKGRIQDEDMMAAYVLCGLGHGFR